MSGLLLCDDDAFEVATETTASSPPSCKCTGACKTARCICKKMSYGCHPSRCKCKPGKCSIQMEEEAVHMEDSGGEMNSSDSEPEDFCCCVDVVDSECGDTLCYCLANSMHTWQM